MNSGPWPVNFHKFLNMFAPHSQSHMWHVRSIGWLFNGLFLGRGMTAHHTTFGSWRLLWQISEESRSGHCPQLQVMEGKTEGLCQYFGMNPWCSKHPSLSFHGFPVLRMYHTFKQWNRAEPCLSSNLRGYHPKETYKPRDSPGTSGDLWSTNKFDWKCNLGCLP